MEITAFDTKLHTERMIAKSVSAGRFPHAVILEGGDAARRSELALKIAAALLCEGGEKPCGVCRSCLKVTHSSHPDIILLSPKKKTSGQKEESYYVEYAREICEDVSVMPNESDKKIYILADAQKMNEKAQNTLLKTLEEPPEYAVFIFLTDTKDVFISTVLSRMTVYSLGENTDGQPDEELRLAAEKAAGEIALAAMNHSEFDMVCAAGAFDKNQKLFDAALPVLESIFADALRLKFIPDDSAGDTVRQLSMRLSRNALLGLGDCVREIKKSSGRNANLNLTIARLCASLTEVFNS